jgi:hypothetical protein
VERLSPPVGQTVRRLSAIIGQVIVGEFCGGIMCMLSIGGSDENIVIARFEHDPQASPVNGCRD